MKLIQCIIRPSCLEAVENALSCYGNQGMTVTHVLGCGLQQGRTEVYRGTEMAMSLLPKVKVELVVPDARVEEVLSKVTDAARTGKIGDGKVFVFAVEDAVRIRTGERREQAL